jgi:hypothetical protein
MYKLYYKAFFEKRKCIDTLSMSVAAELGLGEVRDG